MTVGHNGSFWLQNVRVDSNRETGDTEMECSQADSASASSPSSSDLALSEWSFEQSLFDDLFLDNTSIEAPSDIGTPTDHSTPQSELHVAYSAEPQVVR